MSAIAPLPSGDGDGIVWLTPTELEYATPDERAAYYRYLKREMWKRDPVQWGIERLGEIYKGRSSWWTKQIEIARAVVEQPQVAVHSCHDVGKSFIVARIVCWWLDTNEPGTAFAVTSAPTGPQVKAILWREINQAHKKGELPGRTNLTEWFIDNELVGFGRKPSDTDPTAFQGIHARRVLVVLDEACGIPQSLWDAALTLVTNEGSRIVAIGNPDDPESHFARICEPGSGWHSIHIDALESPNFTGEDVAPFVREVLITPSWVDKRKIEWGEDSPIFTSKVRGRFPRDMSDGMVPYTWAHACRSEIGPKPIESTELPVELGVDVGAGGDETVIRERRGMKAGRVWRSRHDDAMRCVGEIVNVVKETGATAVKIDVIGVGFGVKGRLQELADEGVIDCEVVGVNVGQRAHDPERFVNRKAEMWWEIGRELSRTQEWDLTDLDDQTIAELVAHRYTYDSAGRVKVESKDEVKKRLDRSPDNADALILAFVQERSLAPVFLGVA